MEQLQKSSIGPGLPRRERKKHATRARLLSAALRLLRERGLAATSLRQIAEEADVAAATLFNYFPTKDALLAGLASDLLGGVAAALDEARTARVPVRAALRHALERAAPLARGLHAAVGGLSVRVVRAAFAPAPAGGARERLERALARLLHDGQSRGEVRSDVEAAYLAELAAAGFAAALTSWLGDPRYPLEARMRQTADCLGDALCAARPSPH